MNLRSGFTKHGDGVLCRNCNEYYVEQNNFQSKRDPIPAIF